MKRLPILMILILVLISCKDTKVGEKMNQENVQIEEKVTPEVPVKALSPHTSAMAMIGDAHVHIDYSSPGVRDRIVFGGLLPYDAVWQAGAHMATWLETDKALLINGKELPAGKYGFFVIPRKTEWTVIFNKNWNQHGKDEYDEKVDVLRFNVTPKTTDEITEHLLYKVEKLDNENGTISLAWEKVEIKFPFKIAKNGK